MTETQKTAATWAAVGLVVGGLALFAYNRLMAEDDDRPPIIVRGGSLYFESVTTKRQPARVWTEVNNSKKEWRVVQSKGKKVTFYQVYFEGGSGACAPIESAQVVVNSREKQFTVTIAEGRPTVTSDQEMEVSNNDTRLIADPDGMLSSVVIDSKTCTAPTAVYLEPIRW